MGDVSDLDIDDESHVQGHVPAFRPSFSTPRANPPCGLPAPSPAAFEVLRFPEQQQASSAKSGGPPAGRPLQPLASRPHAAQARSYQLGEARNTPVPATKQPRPAQPDAPDTALQPSGSAPRKPHPRACRQAARAAGAPAHPYPAATHGLMNKQGVPGPLVRPMGSQPSEPRQQVPRGPAQAMTQQQQQQQQQGPPAGLQALQPGMQQHLRQPPPLVHPQQGMQPPQQSQQQYPRPQAGPQRLSALDIFAGLEPAMNQQDMSQREQENQRPLSGRCSSSSSSSSSRRRSLCSSSSSRLRSLCNSSKQLERQHGQRQARRLASSPAPPARCLHAAPRLQQAS